MKAIVLAGGFGTRIQPLTNSMPKPMLPILNRPMMEHIIMKLRDELKITEIAILLYFKPEVIKGYFKDGKDFGVNITYVQPDDDYGTAGAVAFARDFLDETFIIVSGDLITNFNLKEIEKFHKAKKSKFTITLTPVENPLQFGVVIANEKHQIEKFLEKPSWGEVFSDTINTGIYMIEPEILKYIPFEENYDFAKDLFPKLMKENITLWGCSTEGYWRDVGNPESYREVYQDIFEGKVVLPIKGKKIEFDSGTAYVEEGTKLPKDIKIKGTVVLGKNVHIDSGVSLEDMVVGDNTRIDNGSRLDSCTIWHNSEIGSKSKLSNCVICNDNVIRKKVKAYAGVIIAENCDIDNMVIFEKDVTVWPDKIIEEDSIISNNVIWGTKYKSSIFEAGSVLGRTNIELSCEMSTKLAESFGSILPAGCKIYISRDYHKSSRMIKRAFLSGILSTGVNVVDIENVPSNIMRHRLANNDDVVAGVHIRQSVDEQINTEIIFFTDEGLTIDNNFSKSIERIFFRENFRRVNYNDIGEICHEENIKEKYIKDVKAKVDANIIKSGNLNVAVDLMYSSASEIYPKIINELHIDNIILNAFQDDRSLSKIPNLVKKSQKNMCDIVRTMHLDCGLIIYPNGQRLQLVTEKGELVYDYIALLVILELLNKTTKDRKAKVFLPAWAPDILEYKNVEITKGKLDSLKASKLQEYDLIATTDGNFAFSEFGLSSDAVFAGFKILELLKKADVTLSEIISELPSFAYKGENVPCSSGLKGKMMRKFLEDGKDKQTSSIDGVKIWVGKDEWILMVPDQHQEYLNLYIQGKNEKSMSKIFWQYQDKIEKWINE